MKRQKARMAVAAGCFLLLCPVCVYGEGTQEPFSSAQQKEEMVSGENDSAKSASEEEALTLPQAGWSYEAEGNMWQYFSREGQAVTGRQQIDGSIYFFDNEGRMLTGWVSSGDSIGDDAEVYRSGSMDDTVYYCDTTGRMCKEQWMPAYAPDSPYFQVFSGPTEDADEEVYWYYFDRKGNVARNKKLEYEGSEYCFDENGKRLSGWVYEEGHNPDGDGERRYVEVTDETEEAWKGDFGNGYQENDYAHNPQYYLYCDPGSGKVSKSCWINAKPPGKDESEDDRSFYCGKNGYITVQYRYGAWREDSTWDLEAKELNDAIVADKVRPRKVEEESIGTYAFKGAPGSGEDEDDIEGFIFKAEDERYYICENDGARMDGLMLVMKKENSVLRRFPNGFYDFSDNAAMVTGPRTKTNGEGKDSFYYYFAEKSDDTNFLGRGVTGVFDGKLYYQGLAVASASAERYELVYIPEIANRETDATGLFLVDAEGNVKTGSAQRVNKKGMVTGGTKYRDYGDWIYRVCKPEHGNGKNGYDIFQIDKSSDGIQGEQGVRLGADDAAYIYLKEAEE